ncbi:ATP-grasp domain-containing protein [Nocardioides pantholopis]|uniref:ATP-grasp domain-containing protein n=1 Tax=Nocardioides pantholopis TaxID=2483798 RepID=UPI000F077F3C|nr:RimK family alpha-L-glutamate ligase [Nocardioides pantholopis]
MDVPRTPSPITLVASRLRAEEKSIIAALEASGLEWQHVDPRRMRLSASGTGHSPGVYLMRDIAQHRAAVVAHGLAHPSRTVINSAEAIEVCANKWATALTLEAHVLPTPATWAVTDTQEAMDLIGDVGYPVVLKPQASSWGRRVSLLTDAFAARAVLEHCEALPSPQAKLPLLQEYVPAPAGDLRVLVVGGQAVAAERRVSSSPGEWRHNVARGGEVADFPLVERRDVADLAVAAARATGADIAGVDLLERPGGELLVLEVNAGVEFAGLQRATGIDIAAAIVEMCRTAASGSMTGAA